MATTKKTKKTKKTKATKATTRASKTPDADPAAGTIYMNVTLPLELRERIDVHARELRERFGVRLGRSQVISSLLRSQLDQLYGIPAETH